MKTIAELKRRRDGLNAEIARREAEHQFYHDKNRRRAAIRREWFDGFVNSVLPETEEQLRLRQAEALKTIPVYPKTEIVTLLSGRWHGRVLKVAVWRKVLQIDGHFYRRVAHKYNGVTLFVADESTI